MPSILDMMAGAIVRKAAGQRQNKKGTKALKKKVNKQKKRAKKQRRKNRTR